MPVLSLEMGVRPVPSVADHALDDKARRPIGAEKYGVVVSISMKVGTGYVREDGSDRLYGFSRDFHSDFDSLREGMAVTFFENRFQTIAKLSQRR